MKLSVGSVVPSRTLTAVAGGASVAVPDPDAGADRLIHLQFRRFAGCPVCHLHLRSVVRRHAEIEEAGIREVVVFHSTAEELREHVTGFPFAVIADPDKRLYIEYGVESSYRSLLAPRAWGPVLRALIHGLLEIARGRAKAPSFFPDGGRYGLPADFLIAPDGQVLAAGYGEHVDDQWPVEKLLTLAREVRRVRT
ncbi:peroxiredoxin-like family protein [Streptomyces sp. NPDC059533]|uniref:peroxiredoxin-like family protein n=1 Tax=unclassified Streptomyces TaxID=2593676 RepID=UPI003681D66F